MKVLRLILMSSLIQILGFSFGQVENYANVDNMETVVQVDASASIISSMETVDIAEHRLLRNLDEVDAIGQRINTVPNNLNAKKPFKIRCRYPKEISDITTLERSECLSKVTDDHSKMKQLNSRKV
jgi:hypothetical protein